LCRFLRPLVIKVSLPFGHQNLHNIWIRFSTAGQEAFMSATEVICRQCGSTARLLRT